MKIKISIALLFLITGITSLLDWIIFSVRNSHLNFEKTKAAYFSRFPASFAKFYSENIRTVTFILFLLLLSSGIIFLLEKKWMFKLLGILALILSFWQLFSLM